MAKRQSLAKRPSFAELPDWLSPVEARGYLGVSRSSLYEMVRRGQIPAKRFGRLIRVPKSALHPEAAA